MRTPPIEPDGPTRDALLHVARRAATAVRSSELGYRAELTIRPRGHFVLFRGRAPLPLLLLVAERDGLLVSQDDGGFAVLAPPASAGADRSGGWGIRFLRALDRHWDLAVLGVPVIVSFVVSFVLASAGRLLPAVVVVLLAMVWVAGLMGAGLVGQLGWLAGLGAPSGRRRDRDVEQLTGHHWSIPLLHQPDAGRVDDLLVLATRRLGEILRADAETGARNKFRVRGQATETPAVLTSGVTTTDALRAVERSALADPGQPGSGAVVLAAPGRAFPDARFAMAGGGFLVLYLAAVVLVIAVCAVFVASAESAVCGASCVGRPATYWDSVTWLLHRLYFGNGPVVPVTVRATVLGVLVSLLTPTGVGVAAVAVIQEHRINRAKIAEAKRRNWVLTGRARVLVLVVTQQERDAVLTRMRGSTGREAVADYSADRVVFRLGHVACTEVLLAQSTGMGGLSMLGSAVRTIEQVDPDYVILTGICFGLRPADKGLGDQRLGDVVVATEVLDAGLVKVTDSRVVERGTRVPCSPRLVDRFRAAEVGWTGARIHSGLLISDNTLVNSRAAVSVLRERFPDGVAGEMEGVGVATATSEGFKPDWIVVKAICDWGHDKTDEFQAVAAHNAADFVARVIGSGALSGRRAERGQ